MAYAPLHRPRSPDKLCFEQTVSRHAPKDSLACSHASTEAESSWSSLTGAFKTLNCVLGHPKTGHRSRCSTGRGRTARERASSTHRRCVGHRTTCRHVYGQDAGKTAAGSDLPRASAPRTPSCLDRTPASWPRSAAHLSSLRGPRREGHVRCAFPRHWPEGLRLVLARLSTEPRPEPPRWPKPNACAVTRRSRLASGADSRRPKGHGRSTFASLHHSREQFRSATGFPTSSFVPRANSGAFRSAAA